MNSKTICGTFFESQYVYITCVAYNDLDTEHFCSLGQGILNELRLMVFGFFCMSTMPLALGYLQIAYAVGNELRLNSVM